MTRNLQPPPHNDQAGTHGTHSHTLASSQAATHRSTSPLRVPAGPSKIREIQRQSYLCTRPTSVMDANQAAQATCRTETRYR